MKRKFTTGLLAALLTAGLADGAPRSPQQALDMARDFESRAVTSRVMRAPSARSTLKQAYLHADPASGINTVYVFNRGNDDGFVLVSGDDAAPAIIGYADSGRFDSSAIPDNMQAMLDDWSRQIAWISTHPESRPATPAMTVQPVAPLLGDIAWDQGDPYNRKCPTVTQATALGEDGGKGPAATGCVATALGQIMYYHKWPEQGYGSVSYFSDGYTPDGYPEQHQISVTFEGTAYDWDAMLPSLTKNSPSNSIDAVSTLLYHVGAAFESVYGASTGATDISVAPALMKYFGYDKGINYVKRDYFTSDEWNSMLINEFENGRPVAYGGVTRRAGGHFFVLDGVNADGYFHINWGWSGNQDGYYLLTLLEPGSQGIGGADGGAFHYEQNMIIGIQPSQEGTELNYNFVCGGLNEVNKTVGRQEPVNLTASAVWNESPNVVTASLGFILIDEEGRAVYRQTASEAQEYQIAHGQRSLSCSFIIPDNIPAGEYTIRPAYQISADGYASDRLMQVMPGRNSRYKVTVTEQNITYSTLGAYRLSIIGVSGDNEGDLENGVTKKVTLRVRNEGDEFKGQVQLRMFINGQEFTFGRFDFPSKILQAVRISVPGNADTDLTFDVGDFDIPGYDDYVVRLWGNEGILQFDEDTGQPYELDPKNLCSVSGIKVIGPALPPVLEVEDDILVTTAINGVVPRNDVGLKVCVTNEGGAWEGHLKCAVWDPEVWTNKPLGYVEFPSSVSFSAATEEQWIALTDGEMPEACESGKEYELTLYDPTTDRAMIPSRYVTVTIKIGDAVDKTPLLTLEGIEFNPEEIVAGTPTEIRFSVSNTGYAFRGETYFTVSRADEILHVSERQTAYIDRDDENEIFFIETFELPTGTDYTVTLFDGEENEIGHMDNITFNADASVLSLTDECDIPETITSGEATVYTFGVRNTGFRFDSTLRFVILLDNEEKFESSSRPLILSRGEDGIVSFTETLNLAAGNEYVIRLLAGETIVGEFSGISVENNPGGIFDAVVGEIRIDVSENRILVSGGDVTAISVFATDGHACAASAGENSVDISGLCPGVYILRVETPDSVRTLKFSK